MKRKRQEDSPMVLCACDPDTKRPGFAIYSGKKLLHWEVLKGSITTLLPTVKSLIDTWHPGLLVIENQYLPLSIEAVRRFRAVSSLVSARAMITAVFILSGVPYEVIEPFSWQQTLGGSSLGRDRLKELSILKASGIARERIDDHNAADAINIGFWYAAIQELGPGKGRKKRNEAILQAG
jgi:hypothetical protein